MVDQSTIAQELQETFASITEEVTCRFASRIRSGNSEFKRQILGDDALQRRFRNNFLTFQINGHSDADHTIINTAFTVDDFSEVKVMLAIESIELIIKNINRIEHIG
jgi:hypothetical protein